MQKHKNTVLRKTRRQLVFGTNILLLGCAHTKSGDKPTETELYNKLKNFNPDIVFMELSTEHDTLEAREYADIDSVVQYAEDYSKKLIKYDELPDQWVDVKRESQALLASEDVSLQEERRILRKNNLLHTLSESREEHAMAQLIQELGTQERIALHCGFAHLEPYNQFLQTIQSPQKPS